MALAALFLSPKIFLRPRVDACGLKAAKRGKKETFFLAPTMASGDALFMSPFPHWFVLRDGSGVRFWTLLALFPLLQVDGWFVAAEKGIGGEIDSNES